MTVVIEQSRREQRKEQTRKRLLNTAIQLMDERGFENLTVEEIAVAANIGKGTIYNYFRTKEDIVLAFLLDLEREVQHELFRWAPGFESLAGTLISFLELQFRLKSPHYKFVRIFFSQMFARPEQMLPYLIELQAIADAPLLALLRSLQRRRLLRSDVPMELLMLTLRTIHMGLAAAWALEGPPWSAATVALPDQINLFCSGLQQQRSVVS